MIWGMQEHKFYDFYYPKPRRGTSIYGWWLYQNVLIETKGKLQSTPYYGSGFFRYHKTLQKNRSFPFAPASVLHLLLQFTPCKSSWWFQPIWKILVKLEIIPR